MIYFLSENTSTGTNAGTKARSDVELILREEKYFPIEGIKSVGKLKHGNKIWFFLNNSNFFKKLKTISTNEYVIVQYPFLVSFKNKDGVVDCSFILKQLAKRNKLILIVHDIDQLRYDKARNNLSDFNLASYIISHNQKMSDYLIENNIDKHKIVNLEIFDYLTKDENSSWHYGDNALLCYAGNLNKSKFIYKFPKDLKSMGINLYGNGYRGKQDGLNYKGALPSDKVSSLIKGKFGLIWDGDSVDTCTGNTGNYLRYNNPHKLSMYLVANMPVIIWNQAAEADFVKKNGIGITVNSLHEITEKIEKISEEDYLKMNKAVQNIRVKLEKGNFLSKALNEIESRIKNA